MRQAIAFAIDREKLQAIATRGTSFVAHGILPSFYKAFYASPEQDYEFDPDRRTRCSTRRAGSRATTACATKDGERLEFDLYARSESPVHDPGWPS